MGSAQAVVHRREVMLLRSVAMGRGGILTTSYLSPSSSTGISGSEDHPSPSSTEPSEEEGPQHCLRPPQSLVTPGQGYPLSLRTFHL